MKRSDDLKELITSLLGAQAEVKTAVFDSTNPHFKSKYASLNSVMAVIKEPFQKHGLTVTQWIDTSESSTVLTTVLFHTSGQFLESSFPLILTKNDMQGLGSAISYARRYSLAALAGVVSDEDDDGNRASEPPKLTITKEKPPVKNHAPKAKDMKIPDGKFKGKMLSAVPETDLREYINEVDAAMQASGKKPPKWFQEIREVSGL